MLTWLKRFFSDETAFVGYVRAALMGLGGAQVAGMLPDTFPRWLGVVALVAGGFIRAGDKNPKNGG